MEEKISFGGKGKGDDWELGCKEAKRIAERRPVNCRRAKHEL